MRVGILGWLHESNTFIADGTTIGHFEQDLLVEGEAVRARLASTQHEIGGFFGGLEEAGIEAVPLLAARAVPHGPVTKACHRGLLERILGQLRAAGPLDGLLVAAHGAMVSGQHADADGDWLTELRAHLGVQRPLLTTLDPHANLSPRMVASSDALIAYRTNPHLDQRDRGLEAARLLARQLRGEVRATMAASFPPMVINIERQETAAPHWHAVQETLDEVRREADVLSASIILGFPYADVPEMGAATIVVTNNDSARAQLLADRLGRALWDNRASFVGQLIDIPTAVAQCRELPGPICLLDMGDNVGGGSPADGTLLAHALREQLRDLGPGIAFACIQDPAAVMACAEAGAGQEVFLRIGGHTDDLHGPPLGGTFRVRSLHEGRFRETQARHGGAAEFDQGATAIVDEDGPLTLMLTSRRTPPFSLSQLTTFGIDPAAYRVLIAKGVNAPLAAYAPVCRSFLRVNTPGCTCADLRQLTFHQRRQPLFPFETELAW
jgi:microcystin degradation protein MlrC